MKQYKLKPNSIGCHIRMVKMTMSEAMERGLHQNFQYKSRRFSIAKEATVSIYLTQSEIHSLRNTPVKSRALQRIRDLFIGGCYTGLRFRDLSFVL